MSRCAGQREGTLYHVAGVCEANDSSWEGWEDRQRVEHCLGIRTS